MLPLSNKWAPYLTGQPETGMGYQLASVFLKDGRRFNDVAIVGGYITKIGDSAEIPFEETEIEKIIVNR